MRIHRHWPLAILTACLVLSLPVGAQEATSLDTLAFSALKWRNIGPLRAGRSVAIAGSASRPNEYYSGTTGGGIFKTVNGGYTWEPTSDKYFGGTVGSLAIYQPNPDIVYAGLGEFTLRGNTSHGEGVWKTLDGGATWTSLGLKDTRHISVVLTHPWNPDIVWVAAMGHAFGPNAERGVFRSTDGGKSWSKTLFRGDSVGAIDLVLDPSDPNVLYASMWQMVRKPWDVISGGPGSGLFKSTDGGVTWTEISRNPGLPKGTLGNIGLAVSRANPQLVWAMIEADSGGLFKSTDAGATWKRVNKRTDIHWRPFYFSRVYADPVDTNTVYLPNGTLYRSTDGGKKFAEVKPYGELWDSHVLWIAPNDRNRMAIAADQAARISYNFGANWSSVGYATGQFYHVTTTNHFPYRVCGSQQDNTGSCGPSRSDDMYDISRWYYPGGGEAGTIVVDPRDPDLSYATGGAFTRFDKRTGVFTFLTPWWEPNAKPIDTEHRWNWTTPMAMSPHDSRTLYVGSNKLWRSTDRGETWTVVSPDLTRHDPKTLVVAGGPITIESTGAETYATIFSIAESPLARGTIWVGSDDGKVHISRTNGAQWSDVTPPFPEFTRVSAIEPSPHSPGVAYVAGNRNMLDDFTPYLYKTTDFGRSWTRITTGIPTDEFTRVIREDPKKRGLLYAGTERGVYVSFDDGANWQSLRRNLPRVPVHDLVVKDDDLVIATHGRAFWIMDDIAPLREMDGALVQRPSHLFQPSDAYRVFWFAVALIEPQITGENAASGAGIYYWLKDKQQRVSLEIVDALGKTVNRFASDQDSLVKADSLKLESKKQVRNDSLKAAGVTDSARLAAPYTEPPPETPPNRLAPAPRLPNAQGLNIFRWNFRHADGIALVDTSRRLQRVAGPVAVPGRYVAKLTVGSQTFSQPFVLKADPRAAASAQDFAARFAFDLTTQRALTEIVEAINGVASLRDSALSRLASSPPPAAVAALQALRDTLVATSHHLSRQRPPDDLSREEDPYSRNAFEAILFASGGSMNTAPSVGERNAQRRAMSLAQETLARARRSISDQLAAANAALRAAGRDALALPSALKAR